MYSTPLFALSVTAAGEVLALAGSGTLLESRGSHYILTAGHVWYNVLRRAEKVGITLREHYDHTCFLDTRTLVPFDPDRPAVWNEWGPDLVLLRIPPSRVGEIRAFKVFYDIEAGLQHQAQGEWNETYLLVGAPAALGQFRQNHASVELMGFWVGLPTPYDNEGRTYLDAMATLPPPSDVASFGGVSGGGLWRIQVFWNQAEGKIDARALLEGVAFYELEVSAGCGVVRCHGVASIKGALDAINSAE
jgi:hypothetical protein